MLCRLDSEQKISSALKQKLGSGQSKQNAIQFENIRNYAYSQKQVDAKNEFIIHLAKDTNCVYFMPIDN